MLSFTGRVDLHIRFTDATAEQFEQMFVSFYPDADAAPHAKAFAGNLATALAGERVSMAALQHYFVGKRKASATEAASGVEAILQDMREKAIDGDRAAERRLAQPATATTTTTASSEPEE